ncbi:MAG TPA: ChbG/HpnK family deacetylase [Verrucomicrobiae bacterium]|nr:ChbG/HpnK family deacetylase [Verrucomicrobiae bacterium]
MKYLIVNADDFGLSDGVNQGIIETVERGIVTSASLMVRQPAAVEAARYARTAARLSVGLHLDLGEWTYNNGEWAPLYSVVATTDAAAVKEEIERQLARFHSLLGRAPTHLDSHQHVHREEPVRSLMLGQARHLGIPLRQCTPGIEYCGDFYGQGAEEEPIEDALTVAGLRRILERISFPVTELGCHPGYAQGLKTMYQHERALEVTTLCAPAARSALIELGFEVRSFHNVLDALRVVSLKTPKLKNGTARRR